MILRLLSDKRIVSKTPILTTFLLEIANVLQLWEMWTTGTAEGQSTQGWICVNLALLLWYNFYRVMSPELVWAKRSTAVGIAINSIVILSTLILQ
jgi:hypothetical protein